MDKLQFNDMRNITDLSIGGSKICDLWLLDSNIVSRVSIGIGQTLMIH